MTGHLDAERVLDAFLAPEADQLPDRVMDAALAEVAWTPQRRALRVPWRFPNMPAPLRVAALTVLLMAVLSTAVIFLGDGFSGPGGLPSETPTFKPSPTESPVAVPTLGPRFTSEIHAIALSYPNGWATRAATEPWTTPGIPKFDESSIDVIYDPALTDHMFLGISSQSHAGKTREAWAAELAAAEECEIELMAWDGGTAWISRSCRLFFVAESDIGWAIWLYAPDIPPSLDAGYDDLFVEILGTLDIHAAPPSG